MLVCDLLGTGPISVALLHGVGGGRRIWDAAHGATAQALAEAGYRVIALDLPGYGDSALPDGLSLAGMASAVIDSLRQLRARPAVLLGHSMGGMIAQEVAAIDPQAASALVLACTSPAFGKPGGDWQLQFLRDRLAPLDAGLGMPALARRLVAGMIGPAAPAAALERGVDVMSRVPEATYRAALRAIVAFDRREALPSLRMPVLCLAAEYDRTAPPDVMQRMAARIPGARSTCLQGVGHLANVEAPQAFVQAVVDFLALPEVASQLAREALPTGHGAPGPDGHRP
jgi:3-oxoadipate enol-lactonase